MGESALFEYSAQITGTKFVAGVPLHSFLSADEANLDHNTVISFGEEWQKFNEFSKDELTKSGDDYFDIVTADMVNKNSVVLDVGCGCGRWSQYLSPRVKFIEAIDPSDSAFVASKLLSGFKNIRVSQAGVASIPFLNHSFDFVMSLGVLHHIPDTEQGIKACVSKLKSGGWFLVYLYYSLDNRGFIFKLLFKLVNSLRQRICQLPKRQKHLLCDLIALTVYWPLARMAKFVAQKSPLGKRLPLSYYRDKSFTMMRNDALDRFGTPLEKRFSQKQIKAMLEKADLTDIRFSAGEPYWHAVGRKI